MSLNSVPCYKIPLLLVLLLILLGGALPSTASAARVKLVGKILYTNGLVTLAGNTRPLQIISKGESIFVGDRLATGQKSKVVIKLLDGTQISLIENTEFIVTQFSIEKYKEQAELHLLRGGMRAVTGFINKYRSDQVKLVTPIAEVAIRGTDFTTFICSNQCDIGEPNQQAKAAEDPGNLENKSLVKGRLILKTGDIKAKSSSGQVRNLYQFSPIYSGDMISTAEQSMMVAVFRDDTRLTLQAESVLQLGNFQYQPMSLADNYAAFKLLQGSMRFRSGEIARLNKNNYLLSTPKHSIQLDKAGIDLAYADLTHISIWQGRISFIYSKEIVDMLQGDAFLLGEVDTEPLPIRELPPEYVLGPRPDNQAVEAIIKEHQLFQEKAADGALGLYLYVKTGELEAKNTHSLLNLGSQEAGFIGKDIAYRFKALPNFLLKHFIDPRVNQKVLEQLNLLPDLNIADPNGPICEI